MSSKSKTFTIKKREATHYNNSGTRKVKRYRSSSARSIPIERFINYARHRILVGNQLHLAKDGVYTWIIKTIRGHQTFITAPVKTKQELGTLHVNLDDLTGPGEVVAAGELLKLGDEVFYNLQSGTYMADKFKDKRGKPKKTDEDRQEIQEGLRSIADKEFRKMRLKPEFKLAGATAKNENRFGGEPILNTMKIVTNLNTIKELNEYLSGNNVNNND
jgi:hypothetical protein